MPTSRSDERHLLSELLKENKNYLKAYNLDKQTTEDALEKLKSGTFSKRFSKGKIAELEEKLSKIEQNIEGAKQQIIGLNNRLADIAHEQLKEKLAATPSSPSRTPTPPATPPTPPLIEKPSGRLDVEFLDPTKDNRLAPLEKQLAKLEAREEKLMSLDPELMSSAQQYVRDEQLRGIEKEKESIHEQIEQIESEEESEYESSFESESDESGLDDDAEYEQNSSPRNN